MNAVFLHIVNIAITASWLVLAVILLRFALKKAPKWATCLLWGLVALRLLLPFSLESALSLIPSTEPILEEIVITEAPSVQPSVPEENPNPAPSVNQNAGSSGGQVITPPQSGSLAPAPEASVDPMQVVLFAASVAWLCGIALMLAYSAVSYLRLKHKIRASLKKEGRVYLCDNIETPFILGVFRPRIYLPSGIAEREIPYVIAHEEAHLKRKDHLWKPLGFLLLSVYWFNPLLWVAYILLCRDIENACDEKVIKNCDSAYRVGYSEALLSCSVHRRTVMACPVAFGETGVKSRIRAVLHYKKPAFWVILVAIVAIIVTSVCFLTDPVSDKDETTTEVTTEEVPSITLPPTPYAFHEPTTTVHSGVYDDGNRWFCATITGMTEDSVLVTPHEECEESELYTKENPLVLSQSLYKNHFRDESQSEYLQIGDEITVVYQGEIETATFVRFSWTCFGYVSSLVKADLNQDGVQEEYIEACGFAFGIYDGRLVIRDPANQKTLMYGIWQDSPLFGVSDIVTDSDGRVFLYGYDDGETVAIAEILYHKEEGYFYIEMYDSTPQTPVTTEPVPPETTPEGIDILYGDEADRAIDPDWNQGHSIAFENHHASLNYNWALVIKMIRSENAIYEDLVLTVGDEDGVSGFVDDKYRFVVTIEEQNFEIERFSLYHKVNEGYIRMDLGADYLLFEDPEEDGVDVWLRIYDDDTDELVYYAWFTDYHYDGPYRFPSCGGPPSELPSYAGLSTLYATPVSGPEGYEKLFDGTVQTALLTSDTEGIVWKYDKAVKAVGYLLVGAGDDALHPERVPTGLLIYGSNDGTDWRMIGGRNHLGALEEASNYSKRFFDFSDTDNTYQYFKLVINAPSEYQLSEIVVYQELQ